VNVDLTTRRFTARPKARPPFVKMNVPLESRQVWNQPSAHPTDAMAGQAASATSPTCLPVSSLTA
jgi:hypothetical protein